MPHTRAMDTNTDTKNMNTMPGSRDRYDESTWSVFITHYYGSDPGLRGWFGTTAVFHGCRSADEAEQVAIQNEAHWNTAHPPADDAYTTFTVVEYAPIPF